MNLNTALFYLTFSCHPLTFPQHNAGVGQMVCHTTELSDEEWDRVIGITLTGTFYCCRAAGGIMERQERGKIINIASINGQNPAALVASYNVAKAGVIHLTRNLALEVSTTSSMPLLASYGSLLTS